MSEETTPTETPKKARRDMKTEVEKLARRVEEQAQQLQQAQQTIAAMQLTIKIQAKVLG